MYIPLCRLGSPGVGADVDNDNSLDEDNSVLAEKFVLSVACSEVSFAVVYVLVVASAVVVSVVVVSVVVVSVVVVSVVEEVTSVIRVVVDTVDDEEQLTLYEFCSDANRNNLVNSNLQNTSIEKNHLISRSCITL